MPIQIGINQEARAQRLRAAVNAERDRRIAEGFLFNGRIYQFRPEDKARINGAGSLAGFAIASGSEQGNVFWHGGPSPFTWISADNTEVQMDAQTMFAMAQAAAAHEAAHVFAAKSLKDTSPIPENYTDEAFWPL